jgi:hypothetical protein
MKVCINKELDLRLPAVKPNLNPIGAGSVIMTGSMRRMINPSGNNSGREIYFLIISSNAVSSALPALLTEFPSLPGGGTVIA